MRISPLLFFVIATTFLPITTVAHATPKVLFYGDSLTDGYGVGRDHAFPTYVQALLKEKGIAIDIVIAGRSGDTTAGGVERLAWYLKSKPDIMVLALGANDGLRGIDLSLTEKNLNTMILKAHSKGIEVILAGMLLPPNYGKAYTKDFAELFPKIAKEQNITLIPFLLEGVGGNAKRNQADGIHPNISGHKIIAKTVAPYIEKTLP